jgi:hypothetical protein
VASRGTGLGAASGDARAEVVLAGETSARAAGGGIEVRACAEAERIRDERLLVEMAAYSPPAS